MPVYAAVDLGTNNCRMLIAQPRSSGFKVVGSFSRVVRLGEGLVSSDRLCDAAIDRAVEALAVCAQRMRERRVRQVRCVATEACRRAANTPDFLARVREETGLNLETITPEEEASLTLMGCVALLDRALPNALVFDIGGGSTEITWLDRQADGCLHTQGFLSLPFGVVSLTERYGHDRLHPDQFESIVESIAIALAEFDARHGISAAVRDGRVQMMGTSGTMTTLGGLYLDLPRYDRSRVDGLDMEVEAVRSLSHRLATQCCAERARHPCIGQARADLVVAGCAILEAICRHWPVASLRVADRGIREGLLLRMMGRGPRGVWPGDA
ncbi:MAG: Ppx/GppA family phosphatase [Magnetospirillum sp. WYHS-4]